jgi:hypothetical protein
MNMYLLVYPQRQLTLLHDMLYIHVNCSPYVMYAPTYAQVIVMDRGEVAEVGPPSVLRAQGTAQGRFAAMMSAHEGK